MDSHRVAELEPGIVQLELTRAHRRNALRSNAVAELHREIDRIGGDPAIRVVILTGEGTSFCSGADIKAGPADSDATEGTAIGSLFGRAEGGQLLLRTRDSAGELEVTEVIATACALGRRSYCF